MTANPTVWQNILAIDARYNNHRLPNHPQNRAAYLRRRTQLIRQNLQTGKDASAKQDYLRLRTALLVERYGGQMAEAASSHRGPSRAPSLYSLQPTAPSVDSLDNAAVGGRFRSKRIPSMTARMRVYLNGDGAGSESHRPGSVDKTDDYAFSGVSHIFDQHAAALTNVKFANADKSRLACSSLDGSLSVCQVQPPPATVICLLRGHAGPVYDFCWSQANDMILSGSADGTARVWSVAAGDCIRVITPGRARVPTSPLSISHIQSALANAAAGGPAANRHASAIEQGGPIEVLSVAFQPMNNNLLVIGSSRGRIDVINVSTGKVCKNGSKETLGGRVLCLVFDSGQTLWCGDSQGNIVSFHCDTASGRLSKTKRIAIGDQHAVTSLSLRGGVPGGVGVPGIVRDDPSLLVSFGGGPESLCLFRVKPDRSLTLRRQFAVRHGGQHRIRSAICPGSQLRRRLCLVSGSDDCDVHFFDAERDDRPCINRLQGHAAAVVCVDFNCDETLLASGDADGVLILWKRDAQKSIPQNE